jgi:hypothetical protein
MGLQKTLTKEWTPFNGDYEKSMQDIKLFNGDVITMCWPNAGFWMVMKKEGNEKYYKKDIKSSEAEFVRLTHAEGWA